MSDIEFTPGKVKGSQGQDGHQHAHIHHHHRHGQGRQSGQSQPHSHNHHHHRHPPQKIQIRVVNLPWSKSKCGGPKTAASDTDDDTAESTGKSTQSKRGVDEECRLCNKLRDLWQKSGKLSEPSKTSDVVIRTADGKQFYTHSFVLGIWAPNLLRSKKEGVDGQLPTYEIDVSEFKSDVIGACLQLMYGATVDQVPIEMLNDIMKVANTYELPELKMTCLQAASSANLTPSGACQLMYYAIVNKVPQLQQRAMRHILDNWEAVMNDTNRRKVWDEMLKQSDMKLELLYCINECTKSKTIPSPMRDHQMDDLWSKSDGLRKPFGYPDLIVVTKENQSFYVHLPLLALSAPAFAQALHVEGSKNGGRVSIQDFDGNVVEEFLRGVYRQEPSPLFPKLVDHVYVLACDYEVDQLTDECEREMAKAHFGSVEEVIEMLKEAEEHRMDAAKFACLLFLFDHGRQLEDNEQWNRLVEEYPAMISEMIADWEEYRKRK